MSKVNCPYCHHPSLEDISLEELSPTDPAQSDPVKLKVDALHHKIQQLDKTAEQLSKNRIDLLEELNEVQPPIRIVPQEILSRIFEFACSPPEFGSFFSKTTCHFDRTTWELGPCSVAKAQVLTQVSTRWRRTVMATPQVWTSLTLVVARRRIESNVHFLHQFLEYSGDLPLTLSIQLFHIRFDANFLVHWSIDALLVKNLRRIKNLEMNSPPQIWYPHLPQLTQLTHLLLISLRRPPPEAPLDQVTSLSELTLFDLPITFYSPYITTLNLHGVLPKAIFRTVTNCPNLVKLYIRMSNPDEIHEEDGSSPVGPFTLHRLEVFEWVISNDRWETALLEHLHLPSLQSLTFITRKWVNHGRSTNFQEAATKFFARLPTTLTSLELCGFHPTSVEDNIDILTLVNSHLPNDCPIELITLAGCDDTLVTDILQSLTRPERLPQLSRIKLVGIWLDREHMRSALRAFLEAEEMRFNRRERPLSLYLMQDYNVHVNVEWFDCIRSEMEELQRRGCGVETQVI